MQKATVLSHNPRFHFFLTQLYHLLSACILWFAVDISHFTLFNNYDEFTIIQKKEEYLYINLWKQLIYP